MLLPAYKRCLFPMTLVCQCCSWEGTHLRLLRWSWSVIKVQLSGPAWYSGHCQAQADKTQFKLHLGFTTSKVEGGSGNIRDSGLQVKCRVPGEPGARQVACTPSCLCISVICMRSQF